MTPKQVEIIHYLRTNLSTTHEEVGKVLGVSRAYVTATSNKFLPLGFQKYRKSPNYAKSKAGDLNPVWGKYGTKHPNYKGVISDAKGYQLIVKPSWYTGRTRSKHVFYHHVVYCLDRKLTEIPTGYCVHHIDGDKCNNVKSNLIMLTVKDHMRLHMALRNLQNVTREDT